MFTPRFLNSRAIWWKASVLLLLSAGFSPLKAQTTEEDSRIWLRVTLGTGYEKPVYFYIFADHYRAPWYGNHAVSKGGLDNRVTPSGRDVLLKDGESTGWVNISSLVYPDSGARLVITPLQSWKIKAKRFTGSVEFASKPEDGAIVRRMKVDNSPPGVVVVVPPNFESAENIARLKTDADSAAEFGQLADKVQWPTAGKPPVKFPFFVSHQMPEEDVDAGVAAREFKTLSYFGFNNLGPNAPWRQLHGLGWSHKGSFSAPDLEKLQAMAAKAEGDEPGKIAFAMLTDEPTGEPAAKLAGDAASIVGFRTWLQGKGLQPADLMVVSWDEVKPIPETERDKFPALHYYTQQYRTVALGNFIAVQKNLLQERWKADFPVNVNFSDGAVYYGNFYGQGVDYFTLLRETDQNALWSEDWSNGGSTYQNATFNVELMRSAARKGGQHLGQYLIAYAGRKGYDIRLKAVSEAARGIKTFTSFAYGPVWATHEKNPWQANTSIWKDQAAAVREIGAVEDLLLPAQPKAAEVALLYSSAADIWTLGGNQASGFERMHTWLALTHAQVPVDVIPEVDVAAGDLSKYRVCYFSDPNLTKAAALKLREWVQAGGTLILGPGAGQRDEFNRPLDVLDSLLPYQRSAVQTGQVLQASGRYISTLKPLETVQSGSTRFSALSVRQAVSGLPPEGVEIESRFANGTPASVKSPAGKGSVLCRGYYPALDYIRQALLFKNGTQEKAAALEKNNGIPGPDDVEPLELNVKSYNPWQYPASLRDFIVNPARAAGINPPIRCNVPLVDAVYMTAPNGVVIPLANYTLKPISNLTLEIEVTRPFREVRSVYQGVLTTRKIGPNRIQVSVPLDCTDFLTIQ